MLEEKRVWWQIVENIKINLRFRFYMDDADDDGAPNDIMFDGVVILDSEFGFIAEQEGEIFWRNDVSSHKNI